MVAGGALLELFGLLSRHFWGLVEAARGGLFGYSFSPSIFGRFDGGAESVSCGSAEFLLELLGLQFDGRCGEFHCQRSFRTQGSLGNPFPSQRRPRKTDAVKQ